MLVIVVVVVAVVGIHQDVFSREGGHCCVDDTLSGKEAVVILFFMLLRCLLCCLVSLSKTVGLPGRFQRSLLCEQNLCVSVFNSPFGGTSGFNNAKCHNDASSLTAVVALVPTQHRLPSLLHPLSAGLAAPLHHRHRTSSCDSGTVQQRPRWDPLAVADRPALDRTAGGPVLQLPLLPGNDRGTCVASDVASASVASVVGVACGGVGSGRGGAASGDPGVPSAGGDDDGVGGAGGDGPASGAHCASGH